MVERYTLRVFTRWEKSREGQHQRVRSEHSSGMRPMRIGMKSIVQPPSSGPMKSVLNIFDGQ